MGRRLTAKRQRRAGNVDAPALVPTVSGGLPAEGHDDVLAAMAAVVASENPGSAAEALRTLRLAYPHHPLAVRLAALAVAMRRAQDDMLKTPPRRLS